jgi:hypothetical protein
MERDARKTADRPDPVREAVGLPLGIQGQSCCFHPRSQTHSSGGFFVGELGEFGQAMEGPDIEDYNMPPRGQPGLWCQWVPRNGERVAKLEKEDDELEEGVVWDAIGPDGGEKFTYYIEWLKYLIEHFLAPWGYKLSGTIEWQGESEEDKGKIVLEDNVFRVPTPAAVMEMMGGIERTAMFFAQLKADFGGAKKKARFAR